MSDLLTRKLWRQAEENEAVFRDPEVVEQARIRVAYRLVREMARATGMLSPGSALSSLQPRRIAGGAQQPKPPQGIVPLRAIAVAARVANDSVEFGAEPDSQDDHGLPLLPTERVLGHAALSSAFAEAYAAVAQFLCIEAHPFGVLGLNGLIGNPPIGWPSLETLHAYEEMLVDAVVQRMLDEGVRPTTAWLQADQGFRTHEAIDLVRLARGEARWRTASSVEEDRALMVLRLEDFTRRAREALDLRAELGALKALAVVQGVAQADVHGDDDDFAAVVRKVANQARPQLEG